MSDLADRINAMAFDLIEKAVEGLLDAGAPDETVDNECITALCLAYAIACKCKGYTFEQISPILKGAFDGPKKIASINVKSGGEA